MMADRFYCIKTNEERIPDPYHKNSNTTWNYLKGSATTSGGKLSH